MHWGFSLWMFYLLNSHFSDIFSINEFFKKLVSKFSEEGCVMMEGWIVTIAVRIWSLPIYFYHPKSFVCTAKIFVYGSTVYGYDYWDDTTHKHMLKHKLMAYHVYAVLIRTIILKFVTLYDATWYYQLFCLEKASK